MRKSRQKYDRDLAKEKRSPEEEADLFFKNAELREQSKDYETALKFYYEAMRLQPKKLEYVMAAGLLLVMDKSKTRQAADLFAKAMEIDPASPDPHLELGNVYMRSGMTVRAKRIYATALEKFPQSPGAQTPDDEAERQMSDERQRKEMSIESRFRKRCGPQAPEE